MHCIGCKYCQVQVKKDGIKMYCRLKQEYTDFMGICSNFQWEREKMDMRK